MNEIQKNSPQNIHKESVLPLTMGKTTKLEDGVSDHQAFSVKLQIGVKKHVDDQYSVMSPIHFMKLHTKRL
jgi:hypothetical protein